MSYIPDCRTDAVYNVDNLNENDKLFVKGFDWCTECAADTFFDNLDVYFSGDSHLTHLLNEELPQDMQEEYEVEFSFLCGGQTQNRKVLTYGDLLRARLLEFIESERDELITSMIDSTSDGATTDEV